MKTKLLLVTLSLAGLAYAEPYSRVPVTSTVGQKMTSGSIYTVDSDIEIYASSGQKALEVAPGATAILEVLKGKTLKVKGGDASGSQSSYPAILVPENSTLYIVGEGTLDLTGGNAGNGAAGANGTNGSNPKRTHAQTGAGGRGGDGGAGASPAIGGAGGKGGAGSAGAPGQYNDDFYPCFNGNSATTAGSAGANGSGMGKVIIAGGVVVKASKGNSGGGGAGGKSGTKHDQYNGYNAYNLTVCGGGGGGGGGGGYAPDYDIGGGAGGGGGGGGAGSGGAATSGSGSPFAAGGSGGRGATSGNHGDRSAKETAKGTKYGDKTGGDGASGGNAGGSGAHGTLKMLAPAALTGNRETELLTPLEKEDTFFNVTVTFDWCIASMSKESVQAWFMAAPPAAPVKTRTGYRFLGWWTEPDGGDCYYVPDYDGQACRALSTVSSLTRDITLYPRWAPTPEILTVNSTRDSRFDPTKKEQAQRLDEVTLWDALDAFEAYPYLTGVDGRRRITFNLPEEGNTIAISKSISFGGDIEIDGTNKGRGVTITAGDYFPATNSPLIIVMRHNTYLTNLNLDCANKTKGIECTSSTLGLFNCSIRNAGKSAEGAIRLIDSELIALNSSVALNKCDLGALRSTRSVVTAVNCTFADNECDAATALFTGVADAVFANCTFVGGGNNATHIRMAGGGTVKAVSSLFSDGNLSGDVTTINCLRGNQYFRKAGERSTVEVFGVKHLVAPAALRQECLDAVEILTDRRFENLAYRDAEGNMKALRGSELNATVPLLIDEVRELYLTPNIGAIRLLVGNQIPSQMMEGKVSNSWPEHTMDVCIHYDDGAQQVVKAKLLGGNNDTLPAEIPLDPPGASAHKPVMVQPMYISSAEKKKRLGESPYAFVADSAAALLKANDDVSLNGKQFAAASAVTVGGFVVNDELEISADSYTAGTVDGFGQITLESIDATTGGLAWIGEPIILTPSQSETVKKMGIIAPSDGLLQIEGEHFTSSQKIGVSIKNLVITPEGSVTDTSSGHALIENPIWTIPVAKGDSVTVRYDRGTPSLKVRHYPFGIKGKIKGNN